MITNSYVVGKDNSMRLKQLASVSMELSFPLPFYCDCRPFNINGLGHLPRDLYDRTARIFTWDNGR